jgi:uncharacterized protein
MILLDTNLLIYAMDTSSPHHHAARDWFEKILSGEDEVGLAWIVILAFVRIVTHPAIVRRPLAPEEAIEYVDSWLQQPCIRIIVPGPKHWLILRSLIRSVGAAGNLTSDAHLAALAIEYNCELYSTDRDFGRFQGIKYYNPLES